MKKSILKKALLGLVAIVGFSFVDEPTVVVNPISAEVEPGYRFILTLTYTNTDIMIMRVIQLPDQVDVLVPIPEETKNQPTESHWYISDIITESNVEKIYQFVVYGIPDDTGTRFSNVAGAVCRSI